MNEYIHIDNTQLDNGGEQTAVINPVSINLYSQIKDMIRPTAARSTIMQGTHTAAANAGPLPRSQTAVASKLEKAMKGERLLST